MSFSVVVVPRGGRRFVGRKTRFGRKAIFSFYALSFWWGVREVAKAFDAFHARGPDSIDFDRIWSRAVLRVLVSSQIPLLIRGAEARPSSAGHEFAGSCARPPRDCTRREHSLHQIGSQD